MRCERGCGVASMIAHWLATDWSSLRREEGHGIIVAPRTILDGKQSKRTQGGRIADEISATVLLDPSLERHHLLKPLS